MATYTGTEVGQAIYDALANDAQVAAAVGTWEGGPAIFTKSDDAPGNAPLPRIVSPPETPESVRRLTLDVPPMRSVTRPVNVWAANAGDSTALNILAERVARVLDGGIDLGAGFHTAGSTAAGPFGVQLESDEVLARLVNVTVWFEEE